jgi:trk system potassium uptake protein TrkA
MRIVIVGASSLGAATARKLIEAKHDVVVVDSARDALDRLGDALDCGLIHGDGTLPSTLRSAYGDGADALLALTNQDEDNILAAIVGRSVGYDRVIPKIVNPELGAICTELELDDAIFADETVAASLLGAVQQHAAVDAQRALGDGMQLMRVEAADAATARELELPDGARLLIVERDGESRFVDDASQICAGDALVLVARDDAAAKVRDLFGKSG